MGICHLSGAVSEVCSVVCRSGMCEVLVVVRGVSVVFCLLQEEAQFIPVWESTELNDH